MANSSGRNVHRQLRFDMPSSEAGQWRDALIAALKEATNRQPRRRTERKGSTGKSKVLTGCLSEIFCWWASERHDFTLRRFKHLADRFTGGDRARRKAIRGRTLTGLRTSRPIDYFVLAVARGEILVIVSVDFP